MRKYIQADAEMNLPTPTTAMVAIEWTPWIEPA